MAGEFYRIEDIFFKLNDYRFSNGTIEYDTNPKDRAGASTKDRGVSVIHFRDPKTITHIFTIEVDLGDEDYLTLTKLSNSQFYKSESKANKISNLVFNDGINLKVISNKAFFTEEPTRSYAGETPKVSFTINCIRSEVKVEETN